MGKICSYDERFQRNKYAFGHVVYIYAIYMYSVRSPVRQGAVYNMINVTINLIK